MAFLRKTGFGFRALRNIIRLKFHLLRKASNFPPRLQLLRGHYLRHGSLLGACHYEYQRLQGKTRFEHPLFRTDPAAVADIVKARYPDCDPIAAVRCRQEGFRLNLVTESLNADSLFGSAAAALIWSTLAARRNNWPLRIITRQSAAKARNYFELLRLHGLAAPTSVQFFSDSDRHNGEYKLKLDVSDQDLFLATSWQLAVAIKQTSFRKTNFCLVSEAELLDQNQTDEDFRCKEVLDDPTFRFIVNSGLLFERFKAQPSGNISSNGVFFEPAFPRNLFAPGERTFAEKEKYLLFFYADPRAPRSFFFTAIERLDEALKTNVLRSDKWEIVCAGTEMPDVKFSTGLVAKSCGPLSWDEYAALARRVDLAFNLSYTPHPFYPPLDMAGFGAVVLTNHFLGRETFPYSDNIVCSDLQPAAMLDAFAKAANLAKNIPLRKANYSKNRYATSWEESCAKSFAFLEKNL
jgi:hypothetical protein